MKVLFVLSLAELLGMALWFSATAVVPALTQEWQLTDSGRSWLTMSVQIGFVVGTLLSALANLPDIVNSRRLFTICALLGALCNASIGWWVNAIEPAIVLRFPLRKTPCKPPQQATIDHRSSYQDRAEERADHEAASGRH